MTQKCLQYSSTAILLTGCLMSGCTTVRGVDPDRTRRVENRDEPRNRVLDKPSVQEFLSACDYLSRDLANSALIQYADRPVVIEISPMVDRTGQGLDVSIYGQTMREKLMQMGHGKIAFRDEESRENIIAERIDQSDTPIVVTSSETTTTTGSRRISRPGGFKGPGGTGTSFDVTETGDTTVEKNQQAEVSGKIADVDYFLCGFVYLQDERTAGRRRRGFRYYRFQYRLTDARTSLIAWEKRYDLKNVGALRD